MLTRNAPVNASTKCLFRPSITASTTSTPQPSTIHQRRQLHHRIIAPPPPPPTPFVPDASTFLTLIGRKLSKNASKIPSWSALFHLTSEQLKGLGFEAARDRRYLLRWREKFRRGDWGIGGDLVHVKDGIARLKAVDLPAAQLGVQTDREGPATMTKSADARRMILNLPEDEAEGAKIRVEEIARQVRAGALKPVAGLHIKGASEIYGPYVERVKGAHISVAVLRVKEGMWEHKRGHKVDGGERRKAEVRSKRRAAERKASRA